MFYWIIVNFYYAKCAASEVARLNFSSKSALTSDFPRNCSGEVCFDMVLYFLNPINTLAQNILFVNSMYWVMKTF